MTHVWIKPIYLYSVSNQPCSKLSISITICSFHPIFKCRIRTTGFLYLILGLKNEVERKAKVLPKVFLQHFDTKEKQWNQSLPYIYCQYKWMNGLLLFCMWCYSSSKSKLNQISFNSFNALNCTVPVISGSALYILVSYSTLFSCHSI